MEILLFWLIFAALSAIAANARGRSVIAWLIWGLIFGLFALIAVLIMPNLRKDADAETRIADLERRLAERDRDKDDARQDSPPAPKDDSRPGPWG